MRIVEASFEKALMITALIKKRERSLTQYLDFFGLHSLHEEGVSGVAKASRARDLSLTFLIQLKALAFEWLNSSTSRENCKKEGQTAGSKSFDSLLCLSNLVYLFAVLTFLRN